MFTQFAAVGCWTALAKLHSQADRRGFFVSFAFVYFYNLFSPSVRIELNTLLIKKFFDFPLSHTHTRTVHRERADCIESTRP